MESLTDRQDVTEAETSLALRKENLAQLSHEANQLDLYKKFKYLNLQRIGKNGQFSTVESGSTIEIRVRIRDNSRLFQNVNVGIIILKPGVLQHFKITSPVVQHLERNIMILKVLVVDNCSDLSFEDVIKKLRVVMLDCHFDRLPQLIPISIKPKKKPKMKPKVNKYLIIPTELNRHNSMRSHTIFGLECISNPIFTSGQYGFNTVKVSVKIQTKIDLRYGTQIAIIKTKYCHPQVEIISKTVVLECDAKEMVISLRFNGRSGLSIYDIIKDLRAKVLFL